MTPLTVRVPGVLPLTGVQEIWPSVFPRMSLTTQVYAELGVRLNVPWLPFVVRSSEPPSPKGGGVPEELVHALFGPGCPFVKYVDQFDVDVGEISAVGL